MLLKPAWRKTESMHCYENWGSESRVYRAHMPPTSRPGSILLRHLLNLLSVRRAVSKWFSNLVTLRITRGISESHNHRPHRRLIKSESQRLARSVGIGPGQLGPSLQASVWPPLMLLLFFTNNKNELCIIHRELLWKYFLSTTGVAPAETEIKRLSVKMPPVYILCGQGWLLAALLVY